MQFQRLTNLTGRFLCIWRQRGHCWNIPTAAGHSHHATLLSSLVVTTNHQACGSKWENFPCTYTWQQDHQSPPIARHAKWNPCTPPSRFPGVLLAILVQEWANMHKFPGPFPDSRDSCWSQTGNTEDAIQTSNSGHWQTADGETVSHLVRAQDQNRSLQTRNGPTQIKK